MQKSEPRRKIDEIQADSDYQFFNAQMNQSPITGNGKTLASVTINRSTPILNFMENFYVSIGRMTFPALSVPLLVAPLIVGSNYSAGQMVYSFTLTYGAFSSGKINIIWQPTNLASSPGTGTVQVSLQSQNPYYYCYTTYRFIDMMNTALATAFTALSIASGGTLPIGAVAPVFYWNVSLGSLVLYVKNVYDTRNNVNPIYIAFNNQLAPLLNGFEFDNLGDNAPDGRDNQFIIIQSPDNVDPLAATFLDILPFAFDLNYWSVVASFQVTTSMQLNYENIQPINYDYGTPSSLPPASTQNSNVNPSACILTDFVADYQNPANANALFIYNKTDSWRFATIAGTGSLNSFTLNLFWTDIAGNQIPLYLNPGTNATIKIGFFKRSLFNSQGEKLWLQAKKELFADEKNTGFSAHSPRN
jgi:hypothetical protein